MAPEQYGIRVEGVIGEGWTAWFEGLRVRGAETETVICGPLADQAALHGVLVKISDLGMRLISVRRVDAGDARKETRP
jgi:hypothetical protein